MTRLAAEQVPRVPDLQEFWDTAGPISVHVVARDPASVRFRLVRSASASTSMKREQKRDHVAGAMIYFQDSILHVCT